MKVNWLRITLICMLVVLTFICIILTNKSQDEDEFVTYPAYLQDTIEYVEEGTLIPNNSYIFFSNYSKGKLTDKYIYEKIDSYAKNTIPLYINEVSKFSEGELRAYYSNVLNVNENCVERGNFEAFKATVDLFSKLNKDSSVREIEFDEKIVEAKNDYTEGVIYFKMDNNEKIGMKYKIYNSEKLTDIPVVIMAP